MDDFADLAGFFSVLYYYATDYDSPHSRASSLAEWLMRNAGYPAMNIQP